MTAAVLLEFRPADDHMHGAPYMNCPFRSVHCTSRSPCAAPVTQLHVVARCAGHHRRQSFVAYFHRHCSGREGLGIPAPARQPPACATSRLRKASPHPTPKNLRQRILSLRFSPPKTKAWRLLGTQPVVHVAGGLEFKFQVPGAAAVPLNLDQPQSSSPAAFSRGRWWPINPGDFFSCNSLVMGNWRSPRLWLIFDVLTLVLGHLMREPGSQRLDVLAALSGGVCAPRER